MSLERRLEEHVAYIELQELLVLSVLVRVGAQDLKQGEKILIIGDRKKRWTAGFTVGTIEEITDEKTVMKDVAEYNPYGCIFSRLETYGVREINNNYVFYKIRNPEKISVSTDSRVGVLEILKVLKEEVQETPQYRFISMEQGFLVELESMEPRERLELSRLLEKTLEIHAGTVKYDDSEGMSNLKQLLIYGQKCGIHSEEARRLYGQKWNKLKKEQKKILKELELGF